MKMAINIEKLKKETKEQVGVGWSNIIDRLIDDIIDLGWDGQIDQVKEKFGGLRFYIGNGTHDIFERILKAESESFKICEFCGKPGKRKQGESGWYKTLCEFCRKENDKKYQTQMYDLKKKAKELGLEQVRD